MTKPISSIIRIEKLQREAEKIYDAEKLKHLNVIRAEIDKLNVLVRKFPDFEDGTAIYTLQKGCTLVHPIVQKSS